MIQQFLYNQLYPDSKIPSSQLEITVYPDFNGRISIFYCASATFHAPSDISGVNGMHHEFIQATPSWRQGAPQYDCIYINSAGESEGMPGLEITRVMAFFAIVHDEVEYQCALVHGFSHEGTKPNDVTGLWVMEPESDGDGNPSLDIVHLDSIYCAAHLLPVF